MLLLMIKHPEIMGKRDANDGQAQDFHTCKIPQCGGARYRRCGADAPSLRTLCQPPLLR